MTRLFMFLYTPYSPIQHLSPSSCNISPLPRSIVHLSTNSYLCTYSVWISIRVCVLSYVATVLPQALGKTCIGQSQEHVTYIMMQFLIRLLQSGPKCPRDEECGLMTLCRANLPVPFHCYVRDPGAVIAYSLEVKAFKCEYTPLDKSNLWICPSQKITLLIDKNRPTCFLLA